MSKQIEEQIGRAFEYVTGTLSSSERAEYELLLKVSVEERTLVEFWQEHMLALDQQAGELAPAADTWGKIAAKINPASKSPDARETGGPGLSTWFAWISTAMATVLIAIILIKPMVDTPNNIPNTDYIAVLTDTQGNAVLTALTTAKDNLMWLQWEADSLATENENSETPKESSLQLWAVSKRDGQIRSIAIFDDINSNTLALNETTFRLVTDSSFLVLTREEAGGSAIDEPSEDLIARGVCIRFKGDEA